MEIANGLSKLHHASIISSLYILYQYPHAYVAPLTT